MALLFLSTYKDHSTPLPTEHIPQPLKIYVDFVLKVGNLLRGGCSLEAPPTPCSVRPYSTAMRYQVNQPSTAQWSLYIPPV